LSCWSLTTAAVRDCSTCQFRCASLAEWIIRLTLQTSLRSFSASLIKKKAESKFGLLIN
jgi:hypothetical protein